MTLETSVAPLRSAGSHSGQWGLAALLIGGLIVFMFPVMIMSLFGAMVGANGNGYLQSRDLDLGVLTTEIAVGGLMALALFALVCGALGLQTSVSRKQPMGLALGGTVVAVLAVVLSIVLIVIALRCIDWTRDFQKERFAPGRRQNPFGLNQNQ